MAALGRQSGYPVEASKHLPGAGTFFILSILLYINSRLRMTALENIAEALIVVKKLSRKEAYEKSIELLDKVGLSDRGDHYPSGLSGGQQQRVAIARALAINPKVILFDEPTSALDPELVEEVLQVIKNVATEKVTMIIVTHELEFAREVADRVVFMADGMIVEENNSRDFFLSPQKERTKQFLEKFRKELNYSI